MNIQTYLSEPLQKRQEIVKEANANTCPFWLERLQTAINKSNPLAVMFDKTLVAEYWTLKSQN